MELVFALHALFFVQNVDIGDNRKALVKIRLACIVIPCYNSRRLIVVFDNPTVVCKFRFFAVFGETLSYGLTIGTSIRCVNIYSCGRNSVVECQLPKLDVVGSNPIGRY